MVSRMILVGLVAVLGVSFPSRSESGWLSSAHDWAITHLASWDIDTPREQCGAIAREAPGPLPREAARDTGRTNTNIKNAAVTVAFDLIPVADDPSNRLADELNRLSEGLDIPATTTALAESPTDFAAVSPNDPIELRLAVELCGIAEVSAHGEIAASPAIPETRQGDEDPTIDELFADASHVFAPPVQELATAGRPEPAAIPVQPTFERIRPVLDFESDTAAMLNRSAEGIDSVAEDAPPARVGTFEPIKVPADLESGIACELNRASEGLENTLPEARDLVEAQSLVPGSEPVAHAEGNRNPGRASIGKALSLTRDAALAWMNVLTGMTPVVTTPQ